MESKVCFGVNGEFSKGDFSGMVSAVLDMGRAMGSAEAYIEFLESENTRLNEEVERLNKQVFDGRDIPESLRVIWEERYPNVSDVEEFANTVGAELEEYDSLKSAMEEIGSYLDDAESALEDVEYSKGEAKSAIEEARCHIW